MSQDLVLSGEGRERLLDSIAAGLRAARPNVVAIASAFVSLSGVREIRPLLRRLGVATCRLLAGLDDEITHPAALEAAESAGWEVRVRAGETGRFHPKLIVGGDRFSQRGDVANPVFLYVGSGNLTLAGLTTNTECSVIARADGVIAGADRVFGSLWRSGTCLTADELRHYAARFAERSRVRRPDVLEALGVSDDRTTADVSIRRLREEARPRHMVVSQRFAAATWTGLQSFTGEYRFQIEFPRAAGEVIARLVGRRTDNELEVLCDDGIVRRMTYRFYEDNQMFRLNVPNDTPGVPWARTNHDGIALITRGPEGGATLRLSILRPGPEANEIMARSYALDSWDRTPTRLYGWY